MSKRLIAELKANKIVVHTPDGKSFELVSYVLTPDGPQQLFGIETELERIVLCVNDLATVPTETIRAGFTARTMATIQQANKAVDMTKKVLEAVYAKEVKDNPPQQAENIQAVPAEAP